MLIHRPHAVVAVCLIAILASIVVVVILPKDLSFTSIFGEDDPEVAAFNDLLDKFGTHSMLLYLLEGDPEDLQFVTAALVEHLPKNSPAVSVIPPADPEWFVDHAPWLWPDAMFASVISDVETNANTPAIARTISLADQLIAKRLRPSQNAALLSIEMAGSPLDVTAGGLDFTFIERAAKDIVAESGRDIVARFAGLAALGAEDQRRVFGRLLWLAPLTLIGVLLLVYGIEPRISRVVVAGTALAGSALISLSVVGLFQGKLTLASIMFGMLLLGLGIDFGIHILVAMRDARADGLEPADALRRGLERSGTAIAFGAFSSAIAFGVVAIVPHSFTHDVGLTALFGILVAMVLMLTFVPAAWLILERRHANTDSPTHLHLRGLRTIASFSIAYPRSTVLAGLAAAAVGASGVIHYNIESDLQKIFSRDVPAIEAAERIGELYGAATLGYAAPVSSLEEAADWAAKLRKLPGVATVTSPSDIIHGDAAEREATMRNALETAQVATTNGTAARLQRALDAGPVTLENLPPWIRAGIVASDGSLAVQIAMKEETMDGEIIGQQMELIRAIAPTATGVPVIVRMGTLGLSKFIPYMFPVVFATVTLILIAGFRDRQAVLLALLPVVIATAITFGGYFWLDLQFSILTAVVVPVILGLGVDDGIHVVERILRQPKITDETILESVIGVGRPIFLTTATTCVSFAALLFADHPGLESIAHFMLVGVPLCFLTSLTILPAAAKLILIPAPTK